MTSTASVTQKTGARTIKTSRFGEIEIDQDKVITMTSPFLGFPNDKNFILMPHGKESPFWWLQSLSSPQLAFVVIQPAIINPQYTPAIPGQTLKELRISNEQEIEILVILTIPQGKPEEMTANLLGPVVFNATKKLAKQVLLDPARYSSCWPVPLK